MSQRYFKSRRSLLRAGTIALCVSTAALAGCSTTEVLQQGYVVDQDALALTPVGSSREQVLLSLGTPSTTATFDNEVFYYISQTRVKSMNWMKPRLVDQSVLAVYFDADGIVQQIADYSLEDGRIFDSISRTTPTGGRDQTFLGQLLSGGGAPPANLIPGNDRLGVPY